MKITTEGQLVHVFDSTPRNNNGGNSETRHSIQLLIAPETGETTGEGVSMEPMELDTFKIPKGMNGNIFDIGGRYRITLTMMRERGNSGTLYIAQPRDIEKLEGSAVTSLDLIGQKQEKPESKSSAPKRMEA